MSDKYILVGQTPVPVPDEDLLEWARWFGNNDESRRVFKTTVGEHWISTVFLGLNHQFRPGGPPILFETMVFCRHRSFFDPLLRILRRFRWSYWEKECQLSGEMDRYSEWLEAQTGHQEMVKLVEGTTPEIRWYFRRGTRWLLARSRSMTS